MSHEGELRRYYRDHERVRGRHLWLSEDPEIAASELCDRPGGVRRAQAWAAALVAALKRRAA